MTDDKRYRDPDVLRELYHDKKLSQREIGERLGVHRGTIERWMKRNDIETRDRNVAQRRSMLKNPACFHTIVRGNRGYEISKVHLRNGDERRVYIHRLVAVAHYGIDAVKDKVVHHRNGIPWDNRPENLELMTDGEHTRYHNPVLARWRDSHSNFENIDG